MAIKMMLELKTMGLMCQIAWLICFVAFDVSGFVSVAIGRVLVVLVSAAVCF